MYVPSAVENHNFAKKSILHSILNSQSGTLSISLLKTVISEFINELNAQNEAGNTPLMVLAERYLMGLNEKKLRVLGRFDLDDDVKPVQLGEDDLISVFDEPDKLLPLVEYLMTCPGTDLSIQNNAGDTVQHVACRYFHIGALEAMLCNLNSFEQAAKYCLIAFKLLDGTSLTPH